MVDVDVVVRSDFKWQKKPKKVVVVASITKSSSMVVDATSIARF